jgi:hypothetical protein
MSLRALELALIFVTVATAAYVGGLALSHWW